MQPQIEQNIKTSENFQKSPAKTKKPLRKEAGAKDRVFQFNQLSDANTTMSTDMMSLNQSSTPMQFGRFGPPGIMEAKQADSAPKMLQASKQIWQASQQEYKAGSRSYNVFSPVQPKIFDMGSHNHFQQDQESLLEMMDQFDELSLNQTLKLQIPSVINTCAPSPQLQQDLYLHMMMQHQQGLPSPAMSPLQQQQLFQQMMTQSPNMMDYSMNQYGDEAILAQDIDDLWGNQLISRKLQKVIECGREDQREFVVQRLERISPQIERDVFGNYVVQKVFERGTFQQKLRLFNRLRGYLLDLSKNTYGCRVVQKIIEFISTNEELEAQFIEEIRDSLKSLILETNANYVIHKMMETLPNQNIKFILSEIEQQVNVLVQRNYGCKIILRCFEMYDLTDVLNIQMSVLQYLEILAETEPGNYIIQYLIRRGVPESKKQVKMFILRQFVTLSMDKYASNTVEKQVEVLDREELRILTQSLMFMNPQLGNITFIHLSINQYGSFVIKTLLVLSDKVTIKPIQMFLQSNPQYMMYLNMNIYGQRILQILNKQTMLLA